MASIIGIYSSKSEAEKALKEFSDKGIDTKSISLIAREVDVFPEGRTTTDNVTEGTATGAGTGAVLGGLAGLLIGIGAVAIPGIGGLLVGGPLAAALGLTGVAATTVSGAATGALAGGLIGALTGLGVPEETATVYADRVKEGGVILVAPVSEDIDVDSVREVFEKSGADQIRTIE